MPINTSNERWETANEKPKNQNTNKTGVTIESVIKALSELDSDKAYSTAELYRYISQGDIKADIEVQSDDLRAFVPFWSNVTTKNGNLTAKIKNEYGLDDDSEIERRKADDGGYEAWYFRLKGGE